MTKIKPWLARLPEILIYMFAAECTFGASGRLLSVGSLSIRMILFALCFVVTLPLVLKKFKAIIRHPGLIAVLGYAAIMLIALAIGIFRDNLFGFMKNDITQVLTLALLPGILAVMDTAAKRDRLLNTVFYSALVVGVGTIGVYWVLPFLPEESITYLNTWINDRSLGGLAELITGTYRVYFRSQMFLQFAAIYGVWKICHAKGWKKYLYIVLVGILTYGMILSMTRGFWVGLAASAVLVLILQWKQWKKLLPAAGMIALTLVLLVAVTIGLYGKPYVITEFVNRFDPDLVILVGNEKPNPKPPATNPDPSAPSAPSKPPASGGQVDVNGINQEAAALRAQTLALSKEQIAKYPIFGSGLGANLDAIRDDGKTEYMYLDILMKTGIVGFLAFACAFFMPCGQYAWDRWKRRKEPQDPDGERNCYLVCGYVGVAVTSYFNPFLLSPMGIMMLFAVTVSIAMIKETPHNEKKETR